MIYDLLVVNLPIFKSKRGSHWAKVMPHVIATIKGDICQRANWRDAVQTFRELNLSWLVGWRVRMATSTENPMPPAKDVSDAGKDEEAVQRDHFLSEEVNKSEIVCRGTSTQLTDV